jgi:hypothetical protein
MQLRIRRISLLLLPLLAAACAPALASSGGAPEPDPLTARRAGRYTVEVNSAQRAYAYVLEVRLDRNEVVQLLNDGEATVLAPGRRRIALGAAAGQIRSRTSDVQYSGYDRRYCAVGERLVYNVSPGASARAEASPRPVNIRGRRWYCVRDSNPRTVLPVTNPQTLMVIASAEPIAPEALNEAVASVNAAFESFRPSSGDVVFTVARDALLERGIQAFAVHVP